MRKIISPLFILFCFCFFIPLHAQFSVARIFSDHMVIQRNETINVWGKADPGQQVSIDFMNLNQKGIADLDGHWMISFPPQKAGGPYELSISAAGESSVNFKDVMLGDVWLCSGQSNMEWTVANSNNAADEIANVMDKRIRHFKVPRSTAETRQTEIVGGEWEVASPETLGNFTAVGYYFAKDLRQDMEVTIGLLNSSWGGSKIEAWMDAELLGAKNAEALIKQMKEEEMASHNKKVSQLKAQFPNLGTLDPALKADISAWAKPDLDESAWKSIKVPDLWESQSYDGFDGFAWYRLKINLSAEDLEKEIHLGLGKIDDSDITWVNGQEVGRTTQAYNRDRRYAVPKEALKEGINVIAVRVDDTGGGGGIWGDPSLVYLQVGSEKRSLAGQWQFRLEAIMEFSFNQHANQTPTLLYNQMIYPLQNFPIKGVLWYQGESNVIWADKYTQQFSDMIQHWRSLWDIGTFPFLYVQLANYMTPASEPREDNDWPALRAAQSATLEVPNTAQAVIIDIGEANDIHPRNKQDVGHRLALAARKLAYDQSVVYSGPVFKSYSIEKNEILVSFDHVGSGLSCDNPYGYINAFAIAGADGKFHWAKAILDGDQVRVWSEKVAQPKYIRYAWANNPADANLYNKEGLPASPFKTDP